MNPDDTTQKPNGFSMSFKLDDEAFSFIQSVFALPSVEQAVIEVEAKLVADDLQEWLDRCEEER